VAIEAKRDRVNTGNIRVSSMHHLETLRNQTIQLPESSTSANSATRDRQLSSLQLINHVF
jgi:hypothetical protein